MKQTKRFLGLIAAALLATSAWAQTMTFTYAGGATATASEMADGSWLMQLPAGTDLNAAITGVKVNGTAVDAASVVPNPTKTFITEGEIETFVYDGKAYSFRFTNTQWFTAVIFADPEINMSGEDRANNISTTETMTKWMNGIINMTESGRFKFDNYPIIPSPDLVICAGDMDKDDGDCKDISSMFNLLTAKNIPFITMLGNHDIKIAEHNTAVIESASSTYHNNTSLNCIEGYKTTAQNNGIENLLSFTQDKGKVQMKPFTFTFKGVRFYIGQSYWFQTPYDTDYDLINQGGFYMSAAYPANGIIESLTNFVGEHKDEPSVWVQHYPISCQDRWWLDQDGKGNSQAITGTDNYPSANDRRNKYMDLITQTKNPYHFSGHNHVQAINDHTYNGKTFKDHVAPYFAAGGQAWMVLCNSKDGVVEVKSVNFNY